MDEKDITISIIVPVFNGEATVVELLRRLKKVVTEVVGEKYEIIFVNDGSHDSSWELLKKISLNDNKTTSINLSRNFGQHNALMAGFSYADGKYIVTLDDDLQNPPEEIYKLFQEIKKGYDVVYGVTENKQHSTFRNLGSEIVQWVYQKTFNVKNRISSYRIIRREIVKQILSYEKSFTFIDGVITWFTRNIGNVVIKHHKREFGKSGYSLKKLFVLSMNMITNFSIVPLQLATFTGFIFSIMGLVKNGSPIKGIVKRKNTSPAKKLRPFFV